MSRSFFVIYDKTNFKENRLNIRVAVSFVSLIRYIFFPADGADELIYFNFVSRLNPKCVVTVSA